MPVIKFSVSEEYYQKLVEMAEEQGVSIQDVIRNKLFDITTIYTPEEAVKRALNKYQPGDTFTLPLLYEGEWNLKRGESGVFGKQFFNYVEDRCQGKIKFDQMVNYGRHAQYQVL